MNFNFSERETELRKAAQEVGLISRGLTFSERWKTAATQGLTALPIPIAFGGAGLTAVETAISLEGFSEGCSDGGFTFSLAAHVLAGVIPLVKNASSELQQRLFPAIATGDYVLANAMTEANSGSNAFGMKTTAKASGKNFILNGTKIFCTNAPIANGILVYALTDETKGFFGGITCFLLEKEKHKFTCGPTLLKSGLQSSPMSEVFLVDVEVGKENVIGKIGSGAMIFLESMNWERVGMGAMHVGTMKRICQRTKKYIQERYVSGKSLDQFQAVQFRLAEMYLQTEISNVLVYQTAKQLDNNEDIIASASKVKIITSEALVKVVQEAMILHGGNGFMVEYGLGQLIADAQAALIYSGPNDVMRSLLASRL